MRPNDSIAIPSLAAQSSDEVGDVGPLVASSPEKTLIQLQLVIMRLIFAAVALSEYPCPLVCSPVALRCDAAQHKRDCEELKELNWLVASACCEVHLPEALRRSSTWSSLGASRDPDRGSCDILAA